MKIENTNTRDVIMALVLGMAVGCLLGVCLCAIWGI
jgi:uncharacterized protein involved in exopolysaccharide biosynthesis